MIQVLTYSGRENCFKGKDVKLNSLHDAESLDMFEINLFFLNDHNLWVNKGNSKSEITCIDDFDSLSTMISNSHHAQNIIILPQNHTFRFWEHGENKYYSSCELKNMIKSLTNQILSRLYHPIRNLSLIYENTKTRIEDRSISASFCFCNPDFEIKKSIGSEKPTVIKIDNTIITTLNIVNYEEMKSFLSETGTIKTVEERPSWMEEIKMFDDDIQLQLIDENTKKIKEANDNIAKAMEVINKNNEYKSILHTNGEELVRVVFEILETMLGCDLKEFEDKKKEDFKFELGDNVFIGEIKGVTPNVKKANVSQVDVHVQEYLDEHEENKDKVVSLLIINHQRTKALHEREEVHAEQIRLAERNGSLIVETVTLLRMFEKYLSGQLSREECINLFKANTGLLSL